MNYIIKHAVLLKEYFRLAYKEAHEYRSQFFMNIITYIMTAIVWFVFWDVLFATTNTIGEWTLPMLQLLTGFMLFSDAIWQFGFYTLELSREIVEGNIDKYMVRPVNTIFATTMSKFEIMAVIPAFMGIGVLGYIIAQHFTVSIPIVILSVITSILAIVIFHLATLSLGVLSFWFGHVRPVISVYRSFLAVKPYPVTILGVLWRNILSVLMPAIFMGTYPVLMITQYNMGKAVATTGMAVGVTILWSLILHVLWEQGIKRYESMGG